jgi:hypothetical protein
MTDQMIQPLTNGDQDVTLSVHTSIVDERAEVLWRLYDQTFGPLRYRAAARQVLHRWEFLDEMADARIWKYVVDTSAGEPVGMMTVTNDLTAIPWISPEYFQVRFPDEAARNAVFYVGFTLAHPRWRHARLFQTMLAAVVQRPVDARGVIAYDICAFNNNSFHFDEQVERTLHRLAEVSVSRIDEQTYYGATFR